jgi:hypothetical protein
LNLLNLACSLFIPGKRIVTASADKTARLWEIWANTRDLVTQAKTAAPRCMTAEQLKNSPLPPEPPDWCIDMNKWPYLTLEWKEWLSETRAGKNPPLPPQEKDNPARPATRHHGLAADAGNLL